MTNKLRQTFSCFGLLENADLFLLPVIHTHADPVYDVTDTDCWGKRKEEKKKKKKKKKTEEEKKKEEEEKNPKRNIIIIINNNKKEEEQEEHQQQTNKHKIQQYSQSCFRDFQTWIFNQPDQTWSEKSAV